MLIVIIIIVNQIIIVQFVIIIVIILEVLFEIINYNYQLTIIAVIKINSLAFIMEVLKMIMINALVLY